MHPLLLTGFRLFKENYHTVVIIEHDPPLCEDAEETTKYVSQEMRVIAKKAAILLYATEADPYLEELVSNADRVLYFDEGPRAEARIAAKAIPKTQKSQTTLEALS